MSCLFNKLKRCLSKPEYKKRTKELVYEEQSMNIGKTLLRVKFHDGGVFNFVVYGYHDGSSSSGRDENKYNVLQEPYAFSTIYDSKTCARNYLDSIGRRTEFVNDHKNPTVSRAGQPKEIKIIKTEDFFEKILVAKVVDKGTI